MVGTVMAKFHLVGLCAAGQGQNLMAQANTKQGQTLVQKGLGGFNRIGARARVARAIGQKHTIGLQLHHVFGRGLSGYHGDFATALGQHAQDVAFDTEIQRDHMELGVGLLAIAMTQLPLGFQPFVSCFHRHDFRQIQA